MSILSHKFRQYKRKSYIRDGVYHIYNRGVAKSEIFQEPQDYEFYLIQLLKVCKAANFIIYYYCLMPNHVHFCVGQLLESTTADLVHRLHTIYSIYFNKKYERVGPLFQGRFKQSIVENNESFYYVGKYIHMNPVRSGLVERPEHYRWSSCKEYLLNFPGICERGPVFAHFVDAVSYSKYLYQEVNFDTMREVLLI